MVINSKNQVFKSNDLTFILYGKEIIIKTPLQAFYLCSNDYWETSFYNCRIKQIRLAIECGEILSLNDLASYTNPGIRWTSTAVNYDTRECVINVL